MLAALRAELLVLRKWPAAWGQGTIGTALLAGAGRVRTGAAQAAALAIGLAASVLATFSVCAGSSLLIRALEANHVQGADGAMPASWVIARGLGVTLLIALAAGMLGLALGTVCRSAAGAIAAALIWTVIIQSNLYSLGTEAGGTLLRIVQFLPATSGVTLTGTFGALGGGAGTSVYLPMRPAVAVWTLAGYTAAFLGITLTLLYRRDVLTSRGRRPRRAAVPPVPENSPAGAGRTDGTAGAGRTDGPADQHDAAEGGHGVPAGRRPLGVLASLRAELLVMRKRPAVWALVLALPADMLIYTYVTEYVYYRSAGHGLTLDVNAVQILADMLPGQYLTSALSGLGPYSDVYGAAIFVLLGALIAGSDYTASGLALGTVLRSAIKATAVVPLWTVLIQPNLDQLSTQLHGTLLRLYEILPDASVNTLVNLDNSNTTFAPGAGLEPATGAQIAPVLAVVILCLYLTVFLAIPAVLTRRRSIS